MKLFKKYSILITILLVVITVSIILDLAKIDNANSIQVENGFLDLSNYDFKEGPIKLAGEWELYKNQLLTYQDFQEFRKDKGLLQIVPDTFQSESSGYGYGTYRLVVKTKDKDSILGLRILTMSTSYKLMIDDKVVATNGVVADNKADYQSNYHPQVVTVHPQKDTFEIIVQVANFTYNRTGMWHSMVLGEYIQVSKLKQDSTSRAFFLLGGISFVLIYYIGIFFLQRKNNKTNQYLLISLVIMLIRILFTGDYLITSIFKEIPVSFIAWVEYLTIIWAPSSIALFNYSLFKEDISIKYIKVIVGVAIINTLFITILPTNIYTRYITIFEIEYLLVFIFLLWCNHKSFKNNRSFAILLIMGHALVVVACIVDTLYYLNIISIVEGGVTPYSVFAIITIQVFVVAQSYEKSFEDVRTLSKELIKQDKIKDDFLATTSHEIRTPLHGMISLIEHITTHGNNLYDEQKVNLGYAVKSGKRLSDLVSNILDYSKLKNNDLKLELKNITLLSVVQFVINTQKYLAQERDISIVQDIDPKINVIADENRLIQILTNLLTNAIKFTEEGYIKISCKEENGFIEIGVEDTGCGIPTDKLNSIFEAYEQLDNQSSLGTGLGLSISKQLVELHGGSIWVDSSNKGSIFYFTIKGGSQIASNPISINLKPITQSESRVDFSKLKIYQKDKENTILIVDDNAINLQALINILSAENYRLIVTSNSEEAIKAISKFNLDIAILDIMIDNISGYDLCQHIRKDYSLFQLPVLLLTAQNNTEAMMHGFRLGANDFLTKPFSGEELNARVKTLITMKKSAIEAINNEAAFLQAQIKPHFIYNALNAIVSLCDTDPNRASDLLVEFSSYLRKSFDFSNTKRLIPLESEIEYIKSYLLIEQARFENKLECIFDIDDNIGLMIPPLILQPLVENCVKHGILKKSGNGIINISIKKNDNKVLITVKDNGVGIESDKLNKILANDNTTSVGLKNINKRLIHYYGCGLKLSSSKNQGCTVTVEIPCTYMEENNHESNDNR